MAMRDDFLDMPVHQFVGRLAIGAEGEDDLAGRFREVGWPFCQLGRAAEGAQHPPLWVGNRQLKLPDLMVRFPYSGWHFVEARTKRKGTISGTDCYGLNTSKGGRVDRWAELLLVEEHARNTVLAIFDPSFGWQLARVAKLLAIGLETDPEGRWWFVPRRHLTPLSQVLGGGPLAGMMKA